MGFWSKVAYGLFVINIPSTFIPIEGLSVTLYIICILGGMLSFLIHTTWGTISEKIQMRRRIEYLEDKLLQYEGVTPEKLG